jgi:deazaflavin-dependent oxidoreductase (nitroreductase family)
VAVHVPPRGTRGVPFPKFPTWLARAFSRFQARGFRRSHGGHTQGGVAAILLHTIGARSGEPRTALLGYIAEGPTSWLIVASLGGAARNPAWLYNLAHDPRATIEFGDGRRVAVTAESLEGGELEAAWARIAHEAPEYTKYESKTDRPIPVLRLREAA